MNVVETIGTVEAVSKPKYPSKPQQTIRAGEWTGDGLLGKLACEIIRLEHSATQYGYDETDDSRQQLKNLRERVFALSKQVENTIADEEKF